MKDSFILYTEQKAVIDQLSNEQAGKLFKAIYEYIETEETPILDDFLKIVFIPFKQNLDRNNQKWEQVKQKRSEAGKLGANKRWKDSKTKQEITKIANAKFVNSKITKMPVNVNDNVNVNVNVTSKEEDEVIGEYQKEIGTMTPFQLSKLLDYMQELPSEMVVEAIHIASNNNKKSLSYIEAILKRWIKQGYKCVADLERDYKKAKKDDNSNYLVENGISTLDSLYEN